MTSCILVLVSVATAACIGEESRQTSESARLALRVVASAPTSAKLEVETEVPDCYRFEHVSKVEHPTSVTLTAEATFVGVKRGKVYECSAGVTTRREAIELGGPLGSRKIVVEGPAPRSGVSPSAGGGPSGQRW